MPIPEPDFDPDAWDEAKRRFAVCQALAGVRRTVPMVKEAADRLGLSVPQFYRLLDQYEQDPTVKAMLPGRRGPKAGHRRLPSEVEELIAREIANFYETRESPSLKDLYEHIGAKLQEASLPQVDHRTIRRRVAKKSKRELAKPRVGAKRAAALYGPIKGHLESAHPLDIVQMDHTQVEFIDDGPGKPVAINRFIGRRPILAFGNSDGDLPMLQWTMAGDGPRFAAILRHTDSDREYAYDRTSSIGRLDKALDLAMAQGWLIVDMKRDWGVVHPFQR